MKQKYDLKKRSTFLYQFPRISQKFYTDEFYQIVKYYKTGRYLGTFLLGIMNLEFVFVGLIKDRFVQMGNSDRNVDFLSDNNSVLDIFRDSQSIQQLVGYLFTIACFLLVSLIAQYIYFLKLKFSIYRNFTQDNDDEDCNDIENSMRSYKRKQTSSSQENISISRLNTLKNTFSIALQIFYYIFFIPSVFFSLDNTDYPLSIPCLLISLLLGFSISDCDFNYLVKCRDYFAKPFSYWQYLMSAIEVFFVVSLQLSNTVDFTLLIILFVIKSVYYASVNQYYKPIAKFVSLFISIYLALFNLLIMTCVEIQNLNKITCLMIFLIFPFAWRISSLICNYQDDVLSDKFQSLFKSSSMVEIDQIDRIIRKNRLFTELFNTHLNDKRKIDFFNLIRNSTNHLFDNQSNSSTKNHQMQEQSVIEKQKKQKQFQNNNQNQQNGNNNEQINISQEEMKEQSETFSKVKSIIQNYLDNIVYSSKEFKQENVFVYLSFLLQVKESKKLYWLNYLIWRSKPQILASNKSLQILQSIQQVFQNEKQILQSTLRQRNPFYEGYMDVIVFEQKVEEAYKVLDRCINVKVEILNMMKQKLIVLQSIMYRIEALQIMLNRLRAILSQLANMNEDNTDLIQLQIYYLQCLSFNESDITISQLNQYKKAYLSEVRDIFAKDSCVIFVQHDLPNSQSYFKRVSNNFDKIFQIKSSDIIGKKIDVLLPNVISEQHQRYIKEYLNEEAASHFNQVNYSQLQDNNLLQNTSTNYKPTYSGQINDTFSQTCRMSNKIMFALNGKNHLVPIHLDLRVNSLSFNEFGFAVKVKKVKSVFDYILYDSSSFEVIGLTKNISESLFPDISLSKISLPSLFPFLQKAADKRDDFTQGIGTDYLESERSTVNVKQIQQSARSKQVETNQAIASQAFTNQMSVKLLATSNSKRSGTTNIQYAHRNDLHMRVFDFIVILDQSKQKKRQMTTTNSTVITKESSIQRMMIAERDIMYIFMEVKVYETDYQHISNLNYLQISKAKMMNPYEQSHLILSQINENVDLYLLSFSQQALDKIIHDLEYKSKMTQQVQNQAKSKKSQLNVCQIYEEEIVLHADAQPNSYNLINSMNTLEQIQSNQIGVQVMKRGGEKESAGTFNNIIDEEEEGSISNRTDRRDYLDQINASNNIDNQYLNNINNNNNNNNTNNPSMTEFIQQQGILSNNMLPMLSPDASYSHLKQQEISTHFLFGNQFNNHNEVSHIDQSQLIANAAPVDISSNDMTRNNFNKKATLSQTQLNNSSRDFTHQDSNAKASFQNQSTLDSKLFSPRILNTNNYPLDSAKNMMSPTRLLSQSSTQQKFFYGKQEHNNNHKIEELKETNKFFAEELRRKKRRRNKQSNQNDDQDGNGDQRYHVNDWQALKDKAGKIVNNKYKMDDKRRVHELQVEIASTSNSKQSSSASAKRQLARILSTNQKMPQMKIIQFIGLACFCVLTSVTVWQYFTVVNSLTNSQLDFEVFDWPSEFRSMLYTLAKNSNLSMLLSQNEFPFDSNQQLANYKKNVTGNQLSSKDIILAHTDLLEKSNPDRLIFQSLREEKVDFVIPLYYDPLTIQNSSSVVTLQPNFVGANMTFSIQYSAVVFNQFAFWYSKGVGSGRPEYFTLLNQLNIIAAIKSSENRLIVVQQQEDDKIETQLNTLIIVIFTVSACCIGIILPLYSYIQIKKDQIVTLLSTFTNEKITSLISNISQSYYNNKSSSKFLKTIPNNNLNLVKESESRKQNLSQTTRLPRTNKLLIFFVIFIYLFIVCYPIIIKFVTSSYQNEASSNLNLLIYTNSVKSFMLEIIAINYHGLVMKLYPNLKPLKLEWYLGYIQTLTSLEDTYEQQVNLLTSDRYSMNRFDQSSYNNIFYPLIDNNICETLTKYSSHITNTTRFNINECPKIYKGFLQKGFQLSFKEYLSTIDMLTSMYSISDADLPQAKASLFKNFSIKDFTDFQEYLEETLNVMRKLVLECNTSHYNYIMDVQLALIIYQVIVMFSIFGVGWIMFCQQMNHSINKTKRFLQIIDINTLIDNPYIITFVKSNINL